MHYVLALIGQLYEIEDEIRLQGVDERKAVRQERSVPVLDRLMAYCASRRTGALPKSKYAQAIAYVLNRPDEMRTYTEDGRLEIDNNTSERTLRLAAIGRKTGCSSGSDQGKRNGSDLVQHRGQCQAGYQIEPFAYVRALLVALSSGDVELESLLPDVWICAHPELVLQYRRDEAEAAATRRRRRRALRREKGQRSGAPVSDAGSVGSAARRLRRIVVQVVDEKERGSLGALTTDECLRRR